MTLFFPPQLCYRWNLVVVLFRGTATTPIRTGDLDGVSRSLPGCFYRCMLMAHWKRFRTRFGTAGETGGERSRLIRKKEGKEERVHISFTQAQERRDRKVERPQRGVGEGVKKSCTYSICLSVGLLVGDDGFLDGSIGNESIALYIGVFGDCVCCVSACFCCFFEGRQG